MKKIAVIEDDVPIGNMLEELLTREGYEIFRAYSGTEALLLLKEKKPDLILLDLMLPGLNGEEVLQKISGIPVIVLSAKIDVSDKVNVLLGGAADYMTKPFDNQELLARIAVQFRQQETSLPDHTTPLTFYDLSLNPASHQVSVDEIPVHLTKTEYAILKLLLQHPKQVITKSRILDAISQDTPDCVESSLKVHVSNLRKKLREVHGTEYIESVWGIGFKMQEKIFTDS